MGLDEIIDKISPGILKNNGVIIFSAALYLHGLRDLPDDVDIFFSTGEQANGFRKYLLEMGAEETIKLCHSTNGIYDSIYGRYVLEGEQIEIMADFKQLNRGKDHMYPISSQMFVKLIPRGSNYPIPVATGWTLYQLYKRSPRSVFESMAEKMDNDKTRLLLPIAFDDKTTERGLSYKEYCEKINQLFYEHQ